MIHEMVIEPKGRGLFNCFLGDSPVAFLTSRQPLLDGARKLLKMGHDPADRLEMRHRGSEHVSLSGRLDILSRWTVEEGNRGMRMRPYTAFRGENEPVN